MTASTETRTADPRLLPRVREFVSRDRQMLIGGEWTDAASGKTFTTYDPATAAPITDVAHGEADDVDRAVRAARRAFDDGPWSRMKPNERERMIWRVGDILSERADEFGQLEALDNGKSVAIAAAVDVAGRPTSSATTRAGPPRSRARTVNVSMPFVPGGEFHAYTLREPVGRLRADRAVELPAADGRRGSSRPRWPPATPSSSSPPSRPR